MLTTSNLKLIGVILLFFIEISSFSQCYELVWSDEFDYSGEPNPEIWIPETGGGGFGNNELQFYTNNDPDNVLVENGILTITAREETYSNRNYTSARLITKGNYSVKYGKIEARIKLPYGQGIWPAFWTLGEEYEWPACGEIDIMEMVGGGDGDKTTHGTVHWESGGSHASYGNSKALEEGIFADTFHVFSIEWTDEFIKWYLDDVQYHVIDITPASLSEFHQNFFIILNLAVGGNWPGAPDETTVFPQTMEVDYVRVYKQQEELDEMQITGKKEIAPKSRNVEFCLPLVEGWTYNWTIPDDAEIVQGIASNCISLNWGCSDDTIKCQIGGNCSDYLIKKAVKTNISISGPTFIEENQTNVLFIAPDMTDTEYNWTLPSDVQIISGANDDSLLVNWGNTFEDINLHLSNSCGTTNKSFETILAGLYPFPDINTPHKIPGVIEAVDFDYGGQNIAYHDKSTGNEGNGPRSDDDVDTQYADNGNPNVGWTESGEWLKYSIKVDSSSFYQLTMRVATERSYGGPFSIRLNDQERINDIKTPSTGSWEDFTSFTSEPFEISKEDTVLTIYFNRGNFNLSKMSFKAIDDPESSETTKLNKFSLFPNPASEKLYIQTAMQSANYRVYSISGEIEISGSTMLLSNSDIDISELNEGIYILQLFNNKHSEYKKFIKKKNL